MQETLTAILVGLLFTDLLRCFFRQRSVLKPRRAEPAALARYPSISVIRPIRGLDRGMEENLRAAFDTGYPGPVETLFVFDDEAEPAIPIVRRLMEQAPSPVARILYCGPPPLARTGKLHAMIAGLREATGELVAFVDSDVRPNRSALSALVTTLLGRRAGTAFAPVVISQPLVSAGDVAYALLLNGLYGPTAAAAARRNGEALTFIMGQFMAWRRETIGAIGGLECADGQLVDDMYLGTRVTAAGFQNAVSPHPVPIIIGGLNAGEFARIFLRWIAFSRTGLPVETKAESWRRGLEFWIGIVVAVTAALAGSWPIAVAGAALSVAVAVLMTRLHRLFGGAPIPFGLLWVPFALLASAPLVYGAVLTRREIDWRGRRYRVTRAARLAKQ